MFFAIARRILSSVEESDGSCFNSRGGVVAKLQLPARLRTKNTADVIKEGVGLLDWATEEVGNSRVILSLGEDGEDPRRIETPGLRLARKRPAEALVSNG